MFVYGSINRGGVKDMGAMMRIFAIIDIIAAVIIYLAWQPEAWVFSGVLGVIKTVIIFILVVKGFMSIF